MKRIDQMLLLLVAIMLLTGIKNVYAGGPGFDKDVHNWYNGDDDDRGDDEHHWGDDDDDQNDNDIPLDGGLSFLAVAGAGLGIKKVRDRMAKNKDNDK
ncbi:MAG: hypothetical protein KDC07_11565 [Chitinophagaceae bacterium]|nr:hypothetical protein [Chitinophagaceae bacterium]MCB9046080.1 hypothetical protein [Chitinophagales bacterium]